MTDETVPGSRVRATTKHGSLSVDEIAEMQPGLARLMVELSQRFWVLAYAGRAGNWELAEYMAREARKLLGTMVLARPKYGEDLKAFTAEHMRPIEAAIEARDLDAFEGAVRKSVEASDAYHVKYRKAFIRFRIPDRPPDWFDLEPR